MQHHFIIAVLPAALVSGGCLGAGRGAGSCPASPLRPPAHSVQHPAGCPAWAECCSEYGYCHPKSGWLAGEFRDCNGESNGAELVAGLDCSPSNTSLPRPATTALLTPAPLYRASRPTGQQRSPRLAQPTQSAFPRQQDRLENRLEDRLATRLAGRGYRAEPRSWSGWSSYSGRGRAGLTQRNSSLVEARLRGGAGRTNSSCSWDLIRGGCKLAGNSSQLGLQLLHTRDSRHTLATSIHPSHTPATPLNPRHTPAKTIHPRHSQATPLNPRHSQATPLTPRHSQVTPLNPRHNRLTSARPHRSLRLHFDTTPQTSSNSLEHSTSTELSTKPPTTKTTTTLSTEEKKRAISEETTTATITKITIKPSSSAAKVILESSNENKVSFEDFRRKQNKIKEEIKKLIKMKSNKDRVPGKFPNFPTDQEQEERNLKDRDININELHETINEVISEETSRQLINQQKVSIDKRLLDLEEDRSVADKYPRDWDGPKPNCAWDGPGGCSNKKSRRKRKKKEKRQQSIKQGTNAAKNDNDGRQSHNDGKVVIEKSRFINLFPRSIKNLLLNKNNQTHTESDSLPKVEEDLNDETGKNKFLDKSKLLPGKTIRERIKENLRQREKEKKVKSGWSAPRPALMHPVVVARPGVTQPTSQILSTHKPALLLQQKPRIKKMIPTNKPKMHHTGQIYSVNEWLRMG